MIFTFCRMTDLQKFDNTFHWGRWRETDMLFLALLFGVQNGTTHVQGNLSIAKKITNIFSCDPAISLVGIFPTQQTLSPMKWLMHIFIAEYLLVDFNSPCPLNKLTYTPTGMLGSCKTRMKKFSMYYYWINPQGTRVLSEENKAEKKYILYYLRKEEKEK